MRQAIYLAGPTLPVYQIVHSGSEGNRTIGPLYLHRSQVKAALASLQADRDAFQRSGRGAIFGDYRIDRLTVVVNPLMSPALV